jgi:hypothetical protein
MWVPLLAPSHTENGLAAVEGKMNTHFEQHKPDREDNLTFYQRRAMQKLENDLSIHICDTDKHIGPTAIGKQVYPKQVCEEHLTSSTHFRMNEKECKEFNNETRLKVKRLFHDKCGIPQA